MYIHLGAETGQQEIRQDIFCFRGCWVYSNVSFVLFFHFSKPVVLTWAQWVIWGDL